MVERKKLSYEDIKKEVEILAGKIGHKRLIVVFGEHSYYSNIDHITKVLQVIYSIKVKTKNGYGNIRRVNVNCAPLSVEELKLLKQAGIGTYQVFQEHIILKFIKNFILAIQKNLTTIGDFIVCIEH